MWFRQCSFFRLGETPDAGVLEEALAGAPFGPCLGLDVFSDGFVAPVSHSPAMVFKTGSVMGISLKREEKVLPVGVIRAQLDKKVAEIEEAEGRKVGRREKQELKEKISDDLLMRAFTQESRIAAVLAGGYLLVNQSSPAKAEHLLYRLREALGGLNAERPQPNRSLSDLMTGWLMRGEADGQFELGDYAALRGVGDAAPEISIKRQDLTAEEVAQHVKNGKRVAELGLVMIITAADKISWANQIKNLYHRLFLPNICRLCHTPWLAHQGQPQLNQKHTPYQWQQKPRQPATTDATAIKHRHFIIHIHTTKNKH